MLYPTELRAQQSLAKRILRPIGSPGQARRTDHVLRTFGASHLSCDFMLCLTWKWKHPDGIMKQTLLLFIFVCTVATAKADFVIKQKVDNAMQSGEVSIKMKGNKIRMDMSMGQQGQMSTIIDSTTGDSVALMPQQKMMMKMSGEQMKQTLEQVQKMMTNSSAELPKFVDTGKTETIGGYKAEIYTWTNTVLHNGGTVWLAKDYPNLAAVKAHMDSMTKSPFFKMSKSMMPDTAKLPGLEVKTKTVMRGVETTTLLISAQEEKVDASLFEIPTDYHEMIAPGSVPAFKPKPAPPQ
jgi:Domain of unknown function (DUF4412)